MFAALHRSLENPISRILLSVAIVVSLVPHEWMHANDAWFLVLFGPEVTARALLACRKESLPVGAGRRPEEGWRVPSLSEVLLLLLDLVAVITFVPVLAQTLFGARWLRLFRLSRTILLLRYWAPIVRDLATVSWRPERRRQLFFVFGSLVALCFVGAVLLDHVTTEIGDDFDGDGVVGDDHDHEFLVRMWWAFRQLEDPGNLLANPADTGTLVVSVFLTLAGLFVISFIIGIGTDVVMDLSDLGRIRPPGLKRHTVIVNATTSGRRLLRELLHEEFKVLPSATELIGFRWLGQVWRNLRASRAFVLLGRESERPEYLRDEEFSSVVYRGWDDGDDDTLLARGDVLNARRIVLLAGEGDRQPDDDTIRTMLTIVEQLRSCQDNHPRRLVAEIVSVDNLPAAERAASRALAPLDTTLISTEALIARCVASVCRRHGLAEMLIELLRSQGHEIYAWQRDANGRGPELSAIAGPAPLERLAQAGSSPGAPRKRVIPIGVISSDEGGTRALLNPGPDQGRATIRGVIAIADHAGRLPSLVAAHASGVPAAPTAKFEASFDPEPAVPLRRMLVCGFRPTTPQLLETLLTGAPNDASVLLLVENEDARRRALIAFEGQATLVAQGLLRSTGGRFEVVGDDVRWLPSAGASFLPIRIALGDWTSARALGELPHGAGSAIDHDLVFFTADGSGESDARNTTGLMTVEALAEARRDAPRPRVVAEVDDVELAARLNARYRSMQRPEVHVFSIDELRGLVMFQSVVVPHFASIYDELLATEGRGLLPVQMQGGPASVPYSALAETLRAQGRILVGVDERDGAGVRIGGSADDAAVKLEGARLWVLERAPN